MATLRTFTATSQADYQNVLFRRPELQALMLWQAHANLFSTRLDVKSALLYGRITKQAWKVLTYWRESDQTTAVEDQIGLGRVAMSMRNMGVTFTRYYTAAIGPYSMSLNQDGQSALTQLETYDPVQQGAASFDLTATLLRVIRATRWTRT